jgi:hypothetical protein
MKTELQARLAAISAALATIRFTGESEAELCVAVDRALTDAGISARREVALGKGCRIDRLVDDTIGIEVKAGRTASLAGGQIARYCQTNRLQAVILVCERSINLPATVNAVSVFSYNVHHRGKVATT